MTPTPATNDTQITSPSPWKSIAAATQPSAVIGRPAATRRMRAAASAVSSRPATTSGPTSWVPNSATTP